MVQIKLKHRSENQRQKGSRFSVAHLVCGSQRPLCLQGAVALGGRWERFGYDLWGLLQTGSVATSLSGQAATRIL